MVLVGTKGAAGVGLVARTAGASRRGGPRMWDGSHRRFPRRRAGLRGLV